MQYKEAIKMSNELINRKCGDGLMKDVMKACIHWYIKMLYDKECVVINTKHEDPPPNHEDQLSLFPDDFDFNDEIEKKAKSNV